MPSDITIHLHLAPWVAPFLWGMLCGALGIGILAVSIMIYASRNVSLGPIW